MTTAVREPPPSTRPPSSDKRWLGHPESWCLRLALLAALVYQLATGNRAGAIVAAQGFVISLLPLAIQRLSALAMPRAVEFIFVLAMALQYISESLKLFEIFYYWDKLVHPTEIALASMLFTFFLLGYRDRGDARFGARQAVLIAWLLAAALGAFWEFIEFTADWFTSSDLQKSNADTMTDLLANDVGALVASLLAVWLYYAVIGKQQRAEMGALAEWLTGGLGRVLDRHGRVVGSVLALAVAVLIGAGLWIDRGSPPPTNGPPAATSQQWQFASGSADTTTLLGYWATDERGICRINPENPKPGSEEPGLIQLGSATYGANAAPFTLSGTYVQQRPTPSEGSQMEAGLAFGIRGPEDFYLLEASALHDVLRLDRFVDGHRRDVREEIYRTRGDEEHTLAVDVRGAQATALIDGKVGFTVAGLADTDGGIGLFGRTAAATCFSQASVQTNPSPVPTGPVTFATDGWRVPTALGALVLTLLAGLVWLGYRAHHRLKIPTPLVALAAITTGVALGVLWELGAFALDWVLKWDLQVSNLDTMTDFLWIDLAAVVGALVAARLYCSTFNADARCRVGAAAAWLTGGPARLVDDHPRVVGAAVAVVILAYVALLWFVDRALPGLPSG